MRFSILIVFIFSLNCFGQSVQTLDESYDDLLGDYISENNELIVVGRSKTRLYAFFENSKQYRGLNKVSPTSWSYGNTLFSSEGKQTFQFVGNKINIIENGVLVSTAERRQLYKNEKVFYKNDNGIKLGGTLFIPNHPNGKAIVLVHGSGPQDRNGYASIIRLLADNFARQGITVLTYDKQGVGQSEGNSDYASFTVLAKDALSGIDYLRIREDLPLSKIGLGGSSQAGWIIAKALEYDSSKVDFVLTIGAAGSGITVIEQNLYNTEATMKCNGAFTTTQISNALKQQKYFFDYIIHQSNAEALDKLTHKLEKDTLLKDWLFPTSSNIDLTNRNQWFTALEINYNPVTAWKYYKKPVLMVFSEFDDSTPAKKVKAKVDNLKNKHIRTILLSNAQHIGLETDSVCKNDFSELDRFHKDFFKTINDWFISL